MKRVFTLIGAVLVLALAACGPLLPAKDAPFTNQVAAAQVSVTAARQTALQLLQADKISAADARNVQAAADAGNAAIDLAMGMYLAACPPQPATGQPDPACKPTLDATAKLQAGIGLIAIQQTYLTTKGR